MSLLDTGWELNAPTVISDVVDGETLLIHLTTGAYYVIPPVTEPVWRAVSNGVPGATLLEGPQDPRGVELEQLLERAVARGLLRQSPEDTILLDRPRWEAGDLDLEEHTEMGDLLGRDSQPLPADGVEWPVEAPGGAGS